MSILNDTSSRILAFDPGEETGIAFLKDDELMWVMSAGIDNFNSEAFIHGLVTMTRPTLIVLEAPPSQTPHHNKAQIKVYELLLGIYQMAGYRTVTLNPGLWKGLISRTKLDATHMKDAADIARFQRQRERKALSVQKP